LLRLGAPQCQQAAGYSRAALNNDVLPTFEQHGAKIEAVLSDNGREFCGQHPYELFLQLEGIEHKRTRVSRPRSNGIVERLHRTLLDKHFGVEDRKTWFETVEEMQAVLDTYMVGYNTKCPHQGRGTNGRTPEVPRRNPQARQEGGQDRPENRRLILQPEAATVRRYPSLYIKDQQQPLWFRIHQTK
jgi:transposase InsO family protein